MDDDDDEDRGGEPGGTARADRYARGREKFIIFLYIISQLISTTERRTPCTPLMHAGAAGDSYGGTRRHRS